MIYLESFTFPDSDKEYKFILDIKRTCYDSYYPFKVLSKNGLETLTFEPITILYGGNGSGKSTALNIMADKLGINRECVFNKSNFFDDFVKMCSAYDGLDLPDDKKIIVSDEVFDYMLNIRHLNDGIDHKREEIFQDYLDSKYSDFKMRSLDDYDTMKKVNATRRQTQSHYTRGQVIDNVQEFSNGESAFKYFIQKIGDNGLYLLDEPENSLSPQRQIELARFIEDSARFYGCQFIISTHSPFLLAMKSAKIYDLDHKPVMVKSWTELENVRSYFDFFKSHEEDFL